MPTSKIHPSMYPYCHRYVMFTHHTIWWTNFQALCILQNGFCHSLELLCCALWNCLFVCKIKTFGATIECGYYEFFIGHILGQVSFVANLDYSSAISTSKKKTRVGDQTHILCILYGEANKTFLVLFPFS
jgi:hypothetical protein